MFNETILINDVHIGRGNPAFIIAEAGCNHNGDMKLGKRLIDIAVESGANAIKFQSFRAEELASKHAPKAEYQLETTDTHESQFEMLKKLELPAEQHAELIKYCHDRQIIFCSSAFDIQSADLLESLDVPFFKIASGEITNEPLLEHIAKKRKPIILSTGMSYLGEVEKAVNIIQRNGNTDMALLHCTSNYPAQVEDANLNAITTLEKAFRLPVGYSDHTPGIEVSIAAVTLGACIIEKHFTLDKNLPGPDHRMSLDPDEFSALVQGIRNIEKAMGDGIKHPVDRELDTRSVARKSLVAACNIPAGATITAQMVAIKRPGTGIMPLDIKLVLGRKTQREIKQDELITWDVFK